MSKRNIIIFRHFETWIDDKGQERIYYEKSLKKSEKFIKFIIKYISDKQYINKIKFHTSEHDRTIMTSLILVSKLKSEMIVNNMKQIKIYEPTIIDILNRDPSKKKYKKNCDKFKNKINNKLKDDTLYIYVTHSSTIYNLFKYMCKFYSRGKFKKNYIDKIHTYSLSFISKVDKHLTYDFNVDIR
jgi:hypothetical protein